MQEDDERHVEMAPNGPKWPIFRRLLDKLDFPSMDFSLYFLASVPKEEETPEPGTVEAHRFLWSYPGTTLEPRRKRLFEAMFVEIFGDLNMKCRVLGLERLKVLRNEG